MALFHYRALSLEGKPLKGVLEAESLSSAKERLRKEQLYITKL
ncbi:MAG: type II secretion system protein GspF, partial [Chlamydiales bacterium]|nr:type II secretion system protein GspF [Chlamydiales bacterium]